MDEVDRVHVTVTINYTMYCWAGLDVETDVLKQMSAVVDTEDIGQLVRWVVS